MDGKLDKKAILMGLSEGNGGGGQEPSQYLRTILKDESVKEITITDKQGNATTFPYGTDIDQYLKSVEKDEELKTITITDNNGNTVGFPYGQIEEYLKSVVKDDANKTITITDASGNETAFTYGSAIWVGSEEPPEGYDIWFDPNGDEAIYLQKIVKDDTKVVITDSEGNETEIPLSASQRAYDSLDRVQEYLYDVKYTERGMNEQFARDYLNEHFNELFAVSNLGGCSIVWKNGLIGKNGDWFYNYDEIFNVDLLDGTVLGTVFGSSSLTKQVVESGADTPAYKVLPYILNNGFNKYGLFVGINVVNTNETKGGVSFTTPTTGTNPAGVRTNVMMLPSLILQNCTDITEVMDYVSGLDIYCPHGENMDQEMHLMVADKDNCFAVEFINNEIKVMDIKDHPYVTNYYIYDTTFTAPSGSTTIFNEKIDFNAKENMNVEIGFRSAGSAFERMIVDRDKQRIQYIEKGGNVVDVYMNDSWEKYDYSIIEVTSPSSNPEFEKWLGNNSTTAPSSVGKVDWSTLTDHANGVHRGDIIAENYGSITNEAEMLNMMCVLLRYTQMYEDKAFIDEYCGDYGSENYTIDDVLHNPSKFDGVFEMGAALYQNRERDGKTWQTVVTSIIDVKGTVQAMVVQEEYLQGKIYIFSMQGKYVLVNQGIKKAGEVLAIDDFGMVTTKVLNDAQWGYIKGDIHNQPDLMDEFNNKADKPKSNRIVMATDSNGFQTEIPYSDGNESESIARRKQNGGLEVSDAVENMDAVNLQQANNLIAEFSRTLVKSINSGLNGTRFTIRLLDDKEQVLSETFVDGILDEKQIQEYVANVLATELPKKQDKLVAGTNIEIDEKTNVISASGSFSTRWELVDGKPFDAVGTDFINRNGMLLINKDSLNIPTKVSQLTNDVPYSKVAETGNSIEVTIDSSTYVMTTKLLDKDGKELSVAYNDLPLEEMIIGLVYDSAKKSLIFTLKSGATTEVPIGDIITGLATQTWVTEQISASEDTLKAWANGRFLTEHQSLADYAKKSELPTKVSQLTNDKGYITSADVPTKTSELTNDSGFITNADVPKKTSELINDSNFVSDSAYVHTDNNFTTAEKSKLAGLSNYDDTEIKADITALENGKVDKVSGKGLSTNDYTTSEKQKLAGLENYDDTDLKGRVSAIEGKESGWDGKYSKPSTGIPKSDLSNDVQASLNKADNAITGTKVAFTYVYNDGSSETIYGIGE